MADNKINFPILPGEDIPLAVCLANKHVQASNKALFEAVSVAIEQLFKLQTRAAHTAASNLEQALVKQQSNMKDFVDVVSNEIGQHNHLSYYNERFCAAIMDINDNEKRREKMTDSFIDRLGNINENLRSSNELHAEMAKVLAQIHNHMLGE